VGERKAASRYGSLEHNRADVLRSVDLRRAKAGRRERRRKVPVGLRATSWPSMPAGGQTVEMGHLEPFFLGSAF
jgi:hypothetical protein